MCVYVAAILRTQMSFIVPMVTHITPRPLRTECVNLSLTQVLLSETVFSLQVYPSGSLQFVTTSGSAPGSCFGPMPTSWEGEDVIGAKVLEHGSSATVHVYHCPDHQKGEHIVRPVKQAGPFTVVDVQSAKQFAQEVRNANCSHGDLKIGGKSVLAIVRYLHAAVSHYFIVMFPSLMSIVHSSPSDCALDCAGQP